MKRALSILAGAVGLALLVSNVVLTRPAFDGRLEGDPFDGVSVLPAEQGLTFARVTKDGTGRLVVVRRASAEGVHAIDVGTATGRPIDDPLAALAAFGREALEELARTGPETFVRWDELGVPLVAGDAHVAAGTNYAAHARETGLEDGVFLFPKLSAPTAWNAPAFARGRFDYEAELCAVPLTAFLPGRPSGFGYVLCNDFTDRWPLVRDVDFDRPMGTTGFTEAKGGRGMMPLGPFLVVPRDDDAFRASVTLELYVDGRMRQRSSAALMIWPPAEIASRALAACRQDYEGVGRTVRLTGCDGIPAGTILLTGTPEGVLFHPATIWNPLAYLRAGDEVVARATGLGLLRNRIE